MLTDAELSQLMPLVAQMVEDRLQQRISAVLASAGLNAGSVDAAGDGDVVAAGGVGLGVKPSAGAFAGKLLGAAPGAVPGARVLYPKSDAWYEKNAAGVEKRLNHYPDLTGVPASFTPAAHTHPGTDLTSWDGWTQDSDTWVRYAANQIRILGKDVRARFPVGTKIVMLNGTWKYFYVIQTLMVGSDTAIALTGGNNYSVSVDPITTRAYSYAQTPQGFPPGFLMTLAFDVGTIDNGAGAQPPVARALFRMDGPLVTGVFALASAGVYKASTARFIGLGLPAVLPAVPSGNYAAYTAVGSAYIPGVDFNATILLTPSLDGFYILSTTSIADNTLIPYVSATFSYISGG